MMNALKHNYRARVLSLCGLLAALVTFPNTAPAQKWVLTSVSATGWHGVASSADGCTLAAVSGYGFLYTSTNSGATWTSNSVPGANWQNVTCSADGRFMATVDDGPGGQGGYLYVSTNSGATWEQSTAPFAPWENVCWSADGTILAATVITSNGIHVSTDCGRTWELRAPRLGGGIRITMTTNNNKWFGLSGFGLGLSTNAGADWDSIPAPYGQYRAIAVSGDGSTIVAGTWGPIYVSRDSGSNWITANAPSGYWASVASSADGSKLGAGSYNWSSPGTLYTSTDGGTTWKSNSVPSGNWHLACSADGTKWIAAAADGGVYVLQPDPTLQAGLKNGSLVLSWPTTAQQYDLEQNSNLCTKNWTALTNSPLVENGGYSVAVPPSPEGNAFYRLRAR